MITSIDDLQTLAEKKRAACAENLSELRICAGTSCLSLGSSELKKSLQDEIQSRGLNDSCNIKSVGCNGLCANGTLVSYCTKDKSKSSYYEKITAGDAGVLVDSIQNGTLLENRMCDISQPFFTYQKKNSA